MIRGRRAEHKERELHAKRRARAARAMPSMRKNQRARANGQHRHTLPQGMERGAAPNEPKRWRRACWRQHSRGRGEERWCLKSVHCHMRHSDELLTTPLHFHYHYFLFHIHYHYFHYHHYFSILLHYYAPCRSTPITELSSSHAINEEVGRAGFLPAMPPLSHCLPCLRSGGEQRGREREMRGGFCVCVRHANAAKGVPCSGHGMCLCVCLSPPGQVVQV